MSYKSEVVKSSVYVLFGAIVFCWVILAANDQGKENAESKILEQCQDGKSVTIDGIEIHCGVISSKSIKEWNDE
jgi:hypothetical protein